jgi:hypothetical protein
MSYQHTDERNGLCGQCIDETTDHGRDPEALNACAAAYQDAPGMCACGHPVILRCDDCGTVIRDGVSFDHDETHVATLSDMTTYDRAIAYARERGARDGSNAGEWYAQDTFGGRVTRHVADNARGVLAAIENGDDYGGPTADLSGEWADTLTGPQLVEDALFHVDPLEEHRAGIDGHAIFTDICDAYEDAYRMAADDTIARLARLAIPDAD